MEAATLLAREPETGFAKMTEADFALARSLAVTFSLS
ncbi:MAG: hypothetical protein QOJ51_6803 [Acidobacteriaceae bacterium]|jgi:hypothetical protein|nr:hypothetical protein [Acidobacteriaceae bacterium]MEA2263978.1 hypothetical protein [Acidobacteriaceae bacterium]